MARLSLAPLVDRLATVTAPGALDNLVLTGSPGTGVWDASEWNVPPGQAYYSAATPRWVPAGPYPDPALGEMIYPGPSTYYAFDRDDVVTAGASSRAGALVGEWASFCDARVSFRGTHGRVLVVAGGAVGLADVIVAADESQGARIHALQAGVLAFADLGGV